MGSTMLQTYDFIIVGAGPAGCAVARRLAETAKKPSILLIEAGSDNSAMTEYRKSDARYSIAFTEPKLDWGYTTTKQACLNDRKILQNRGKGLGGSSAVNYSCWCLGSQEDYNEWADQVGDSAWNWSNVKRRYAKVEKFNIDINQEQQDFIDVSTHSTTGNVDIGYAKSWDIGHEEVVFSAAKEIGYTINKDGNSGDPTGVSIAPSTFFGGERVTAAEAYLRNTPENLTILPDTAVAKVVITDLKATGVLTTDGVEYHAKHEVIISAGTLNTPQILMLSGIGPANELNKHNIPIIKELPGIGQHLIDHLFASICHLLKPDAIIAKSSSAAPNPPTPDPKFQVGGQCIATFLKNPNITNSNEYKALPSSVTSYLSRPTVPHHEFMAFPGIISTGSYKPKPTDRFRTQIVFLMNLQSSGSITLQSSSPTDAPIINPNYLSHPYDERIAIESLRELMKFQTAPSFASTVDRLVDGPDNPDDDATLLEYWRSHAASVWHMSGTVMMGKSEDPNTCVTSDCRVVGIKGLRVADMSVAPLLINGHTVAPAYLVGETCAEKLIAEYGLNE